MKKFILIYLIPLLLIVSAAFCNFDGPDDWEKHHNTYQPPEKVMDAMGVKPGMTIAEVGAGRGRYAVRIANRVGETGKIYLDKERNKTYRWSGSEYIFVGNALELGESDTTAHRGDHGKAAYEHSQADHAPADATNGADWEVNLSNKPTTITAEQTTAIEANTEKRTYPESDETKLEGIEENATVGADWDANIANKPTTISEEQATAIEANTAKRSYSETDENKLSGVEENATVGADWEVNLSNKPTTITAEQATAIETNTEKRTYPEADETKLGGIEENATAGASWDAVQNKPAVLDLLIAALEQSVVTGITIDADGKHMRFDLE